MRCLLLKIGEVKNAIATYEQIDSFYGMIPCNKGRIKGRNIMKPKLKVLIFTILEIILMIITYSCIEFGYSVYFGDTLSGMYEYGLPLVFLAWIPLAIGIFLIPSNLILIFLIVRNIIFSIKSC